MLAPDAYDNSILTSLEWFYLQLLNSFAPGVKLVGYVTKGTKIPDCDSAASVPRQSTDIVTLLQSHASLVQRKRRCLSNKARRLRPQIVFASKHPPLAISDQRIYCTRRLPVLLLLQQRRFKSACSVLVSLELGPDVSHHDSRFIFRTLGIAGRHQKHARKGCARHHERGYS